MAALDIITLDTATPQLEVPQTGDTYNAPRAIAIAPETLTGSAATTSLDVTQTWNTSGTPTALKLNVTDTASNAASLLMDLQVGGVSKASVTKSGRVAAGLGYIYAQPQFYDSSIGSGAGFQISDANTTALYGGGNALFAVNQSLGIRIDGSTSLGWLSSHALANVADVRLFRDAADTLAQRNSTNAQTFRVYNTFTDASNYERGKIEWASNVLRIGTEKAGTGTARALEFQTDGTTRLTIATNGAISAASNLSCDGEFSAGAGQAIGFTGRSKFNSASTGVLALLNAAENDFGRLQFGGTTSSYPAIKRNATALETKLADDSAFAPHAMQYLDVTDGITAPAAATGRARIYVDTADGDLKVIFADGTIKTIVTDT